VEAFKIGQAPAAAAKPGPHTKSSSGNGQSLRGVPATASKVNPKSGAAKRGGQARPVAEGLVMEREEWGLDASGAAQRVPSFFSGPSATQKREWMRQGSGW